MNELSCDAIARMLVDYADGELPVADRQRVKQHLATCPGCSAEVDRLDRSLELARSVWREAADRVSECATVSPLATHPTHRPRWAGVAAASAALVLLSLGAWFAARGHRQVASRHEAAPSGFTKTGPTVSDASPRSSVVDADIAEMLAREARAARLAVAAKLLATEPSLKTYQNEAERYLAEAYPEASVTRQLPRRVVFPSSKEPKS